ncbi:MAG: glucose-6-phosphate dehydrogenase [Spirochaetia bacterium]|jgi:glucose-6-phosphate 1-dehydrogenase|nr:glucose-6-phosphate dehydrogenase [Spirochaetia bacterium]
MTENSIIVIFGATGDLAKRKLYPALEELSEKNLVSPETIFLGVGRRQYSDAEFRMRIPALLKERFFYQQLDTADPDDYVKLKNRLDKLDNDYSAGGKFVFYLAVPPSMYKSIIEGIGETGLNLEAERKPEAKSRLDALGTPVEESTPEAEGAPEAERNLEAEGYTAAGSAASPAGSDTKGRGWKRIVVEKPFGHSWESALELNKFIHTWFTEKQIYRIDHYLGKETVQNIMAFRFANGIFEPLWNRNYISHIEITASENIGIEKRGSYYDSAGAMRDMVQNHLLQLTAIAAMEPPPFFTPDAVRTETLKVFQSLRRYTPDEIISNMILGQYVDSTIRGEKVAAYRDEEDVSADSRTETYAALRIFVDNWRWGGVPFYLRTGKRLPTRVTEIVVHFRETPHKLFKVNSGNCCQNKLILRIQPDEGVLLTFGLKQPGSGFEITSRDMDFKYSEIGEFKIPDAYERLLYDVMTGDSTLFTRGDSVEECWKFIDPFISCKDNDSRVIIHGYPAGTWGPVEADTFISESGKGWRSPCKNLTEAGNYCEL